ncbi:MAG: serine hydrolase [Gemmatimonadota bacterium]|nr:serine hydrolase [Gemmatimonadota bacterium]
MLKVIVTALTLVHGGDGLPSKAPDAVGMSASRLESIDRVVQRGIAAGGYPGAAVVVGRKGAAVWEKGFGRLSWSTVSGDVDAENTIYDVASLSKVVGTATAVMVLYDEKKIDLDAPVFRYLPAFSGGSRDRVTVRDLLTHRSGLPAGRDLWRRARSPQQARDMILETPLEYYPGAAYIYSDLGADVLGMIVEAVSGQRLDIFLNQRVFGPLGMRDTYYRPPDSLRYRIAPTEVTPPRGYPLRGEVHDENAYALGGVAGHAGLFSTATDLSIFAQMMLNGGTYDGVQILSEPTVALFTRRAAGHRALGWDTADGDYGSGRYLTERAYGHTGYTGTSIWIDPDREMFVVLLTNRVHASKAQRPARIIADIRSDLSDAAVLAVLDGPTPVLAMPTAFRADQEVGWTRPKPQPVRCTKARRSRGARGSKRSRVKCVTASRKSASSRASKSRSSKSASAKAKRSSSKSSVVKSKRTSSKNSAIKAKRSSTRSSGLKAKSARARSASARAKSATRTAAAKSTRTRSRR